MENQPCGSVLVTLSQSSGDIGRVTRSTCSVHPLRSELECSAAAVNPPLRRRRRQRGGGQCGERRTERIGRIGRLQPVSGRRPVSTDTAPTAVTRRPTEPGTAARRASSGRRPTTTPAATTRRPGPTRPSTSARADRETFRTSPSTPKRTIRTSEEGGQSGVGGAYDCGAASL